MNGKKTIIIPHGFEPNYTIGFVRGLAANDISPLVISSDIDQERLLRNDIENINLRGSQDPSRPLIKKFANILRYYFRLAAFLLRHRGNIVHFTGIFGNRFILFDGIIFNLFLKLISRRYIYTVHNVLPHNKENSGFYKLAYRWIYIVPDVLVVHTGRAKEQLVRDFLVPREKIFVISIGLNEEVPHTNMSRKEARERLGLSLEDNVILFFGKADEYKGLDVLVKAFTSLNLTSKKLLISAWFPNSGYRQKIVSEIGLSDCKNDILLHEGFIPNRDIEIFFKSADLLALPYRDIYQSGVLFLALSFGLPVLATDVGSFRDYIEEDMGIIVNDNGVKQVTNGIERFFEAKNKFKRCRIIRRAQKYRWDKVCRALMALYA